MNSRDPLYTEFDFELHNPGRDGGPALMRRPRGAVRFGARA